MFVIDACHDNPFPKQGTCSIGSTRGLLPPEPATGQVIIMSAGRNQKALDSVPGVKADNGLFTYQLTQVIAQPGVEIRVALEKVKSDVDDKARKVGHEQRPSLVNDLRGDFYFFGPTTVQVIQPGAGNAPAPYVAPAKTADQIEDDTWDSVKDSADLASLEEYLLQYPKGRHVGQARVAIVKLKAAAKRTSSGTVPEPRPQAEPVKPQQAAATPLIDNRYQVLGNGSEIKDVQTGLIGQRCSLGQSWTGSTCAGDAKTFTFDNAQQQAGNGWRVPTVRELHSLVWCSSGKTRNRADPKDGKAALENNCDGEYTRPTIRQAAFPNPPSYAYWTSTPSEGIAGLAWIVYFSNGYVYDSSAASATMCALCGSGGCCVVSEWRARQCLEREALWLFRAHERLQ